MRLTLIAACAALTATLVAVLPAAAAPEIELPRFDTIKVSNGAHVVLRHGPQKLRLINGSWERHGRPGKILEIDACKPSCAEGRNLTMEVFTPGISEIQVIGGGKVEWRGDFPRQPQLRIGVTRAGLVDSRSATVGIVTAAVDGGTILTRAEDVLSVTLGPKGTVRYWGKPNVVNTNTHGAGGLIERGD